MKNTTTNSNRHFPLFQSHIDLAHSYWKRLLSVGDIAVDATCGNGHDTLLLAETVLTETSGTVYAFDVQAQAIQATRERAEAKLGVISQRIITLQQSHETFPEEFASMEIKLFIYNLGYLPGADKSKTTETGSTLRSIQQACALVTPGGAISVTCYPGHPEGALEEKALLEYAESLCKETWEVCHHRWSNRSKAPSLLLLLLNAKTRSSES